MATSSTLPAVKAQLVSLLTTALATSGASGGAVHVDYSWSPNVEDEAVFLGRRDEDGPVWSSVLTHDIATIKAGRKWRDENYTVELTVWTHRPDVSPTAANEVEERAFELVEKVEDVLANDPTLGLDVIQWAKVASIDAAGRALDGGWFVTCVITVEVQARLK